MLRRPPTVITLDAKDLEDYEKRRQERLREQQNARSAAKQGASAGGTGGHGKTEQDRTKAPRTQHERIMGGGGA